MANPLLSDRDVDFLLYELLRVEGPRDVYDLYLASARRLAREVLYPSYPAIDRSPPVFEHGRVKVHPKLREIYPQLVALGTLSTRESLPLSVSSLAHAYLMAANLSAAGYVGLTVGAAHLVESFGDARVRAEILPHLLSGEWTGTMALTEPQAGSSLADVKTRATPSGDHFSISGAKIFISGADHDLTENVVQMTLARIDGAPAGSKGVSLFAVPNRRIESGALVDNDVRVAGLIHKIGWRGLPSLILSYGERGDCRGLLVGEPGKGLAHMFQMMNEARIMVGLNAIATASVAYHESLAYARTRTQGRPIGARDPMTPQVPLTAHADVRRMLLRQKAIVEGGLALLATAAHHADLAARGNHRSQLLLDLLTPIAKSFPAEWGFESNALALQIHGGYGYSSEYLPEAWLRDQKLNSIHEGTTGIQSIDLLGRKAIAEGGAALMILDEEVRATLARAKDVPGIDALARALGELENTTRVLVGRTPEQMLLHSADYLSLACLVVVGWQHAAMAALAAPKRSDPFYAGKLAAASYFLRTEVPRSTHLAHLCTSGEDSYAAVADEAW